MRDPQHDAEEVPVAAQLDAAVDAARAEAAAAQQGLRDVFEEHDRLAEDRDLHLTEDQLRAISAGEDTPEHVRDCAICQRSIEEWQAFGDLFDRERASG